MPSEIISVVAVRAARRGEAFDVLEREEVGLDIVWLRDVRASCWAVRPDHATRGGCRGALRKELAGRFRALATVDAGGRGSLN
jgi:hypothetical protein